MADATRPDASVLERVRHAALRRGLSKTPFRHREIMPWALLGMGLLAVLTIAPFVNPRLSYLTERLLTLGALVFLLAAPGLWLGFSKRALAISGVLVLGLYAATAFVVDTGPVRDLFVVGVLLSFLVFALAGFELVFVIEEVVYDAHRLLLPHRRGFAASPLVLVSALAFGLPWWSSHGGPVVPATILAAAAMTILLAAWWLVRSFNPVDPHHTVLREIHLFVAGTLASALLLDGIQYLQGAEKLLPSLLAYLVLLGTWVYVSYTTLQRTHLLVRGRNAAPWAAILLAGTYAIAAHAQAQYLLEGSALIDTLVRQRITYMVIGVWIGLAFFAARSVWRALRLLGRQRDLTPRGRQITDQAARVAEGMLRTEHLVGAATRDLYRRLDRVIPTKTEKPHWELDPGSQTLERVKDVASEDE